MIDIGSIMKEHGNRKYMPFTNRDKTMYRLINDVAQELTKNVSHYIVYGFISSTFSISYFKVSHFRSGFKF